LINTEFEASLLKCEMNVADPSRHPGGAQPIQLPDGVKMMKPSSQPGLAT